QACETAKVLGAIVSRTAAPAAEIVRPTGRPAGRPDTAASARKLPPEPALDEADPTLDRGAPRLMLPWAPWRPARPMLDQPPPTLDAPQAFQSQLRSNLGGPRSKVGSPRTEVGAGRPKVGSAFS